MPITIEQNHALVTATGDLTQLLLLDDLWTAAAIAGPPLPDSGEADTWYAELAAVVTDIHTLIDRAGEHAKLIASLAEVHAEELDESLSALLWSNSLTRSDRDDLRWFTARHGRAQYMAGAAVASLLNTEDEHLALQEQRDLMLTGRPSSGDLSKSFRCGTAQGIVVGGALMAGGAPLGGGAAAAAGAGVGMVAGVLATGGLAGIGVVLVGVWWARRHHC